MQAFRLSSRALFNIVIVVATAFRLYVLGRGDPISGEVLYIFRSIGYLDFDFALYQPTTLQLFTGAIPWWTALSFHDHPPLVFLVQHVFMGVFGVSLWAARLPSALLGIGSVALIYYIGKKLFSEKTGVIAAALMACNVLMLYVSRTGMQEAQVIFLILLSVFFFIKTQDNPLWFLAVGTALGFGFLSKYTAIFVPAALVIYMLLYNRTALKHGYSYFGAAVGLVIVSPVIVYNALLYRTFGHFDFQLFYLFGQRVSYWRAMPGKEEYATIMQRVIGIGYNLFVYHSAILSLVGIVSVAALVYWGIWKKQKQRKSYVLVALLIACNLLIYLGIGPSPRFLAMLIPWLLLAIACSAGAMISSPHRYIRRGAVVLVLAVLLWEVWYSYNSVIAYSPAGPEGATHSRIHWDVHAWGYNALDRSIVQLIDAKYSALTIPYTYEFLEAIKRDAIARAQQQGRMPVKTLFVYSDRLSDLATLWVFNRHSVYEAWPMISAENYQKARAEKGDNFYAENGFVDMYFVQATDAVLQNRSGRISGDGDALEQQLIEQRAPMVEIQNHSGTTAFRVYHETYTLAQQSGTVK